MEYKDYYKILGVSKDADQKAIKRAYKKLARKYHPDVSKEAGAEAKFKEVGEAYEVLKDPEKRKAYDQFGMNWKHGQDFTPPPGWDPSGFDFSGGGYTSGNAEDFSDFFESIFGGRARGGQAGFDFGGSAGFGGGQRRTYARRGEDISNIIQIPLEDSFTGATRTIKYRKPELLPDGRMTLNEVNLNVKIPKGIREGQHIRLSGQGKPGMGGGPAGDLYLKVQFLPHPYYKVEGNDLYLDLPVAPWEAALGAKVEVPTPSGKVKLSVPANAKQGQKMRLKGKGLPGKNPGDLYAVINIAMPDHNERAKDEWLKLKEKLDFNPRAHLS